MQDNEPTNDSANGNGLRQTAKFFRDLSVCLLYFFRDNKEKTAGIEKILENENVKETEKFFLKLFVQPSKESRNEIFHKSPLDIVTLLDAALPYIQDDITRDEIAYLMPEILTDPKDEDTLAAIKKVLEEYNAGNLISLVDYKVDKEKEQYQNLLKCTKRFNHAACAAFKQNTELMKTAKSKLQEATNNENCLILYSKEFEPDIEKTDLLASVLVQTFYDSSIARKKHPEEAQKMAMAKTANFLPDWAKYGPGNPRLYRDLYERYNAPTLSKLCGRYIT